MKVSIGRIVLVVDLTSKDSQTRPAIVVMTHDNADQAVDAQMFLDDDAGVRLVSNVPHESSAAVDQEQDVFYWIWPPRES